MIFRFEQMIPLPLLEQDTAGSEVWEADSLLLEQGKSYVIEAPSGRGKTSLLSVMYGIRTDYQGDVFLDGRNIKSFTMREWSALRKKRLSIIFQGLELFDDLSTLENIQLKNNITGHVSNERIGELAHALGMEPYLHRLAGILSFGQQQRVAIIRALVQPFDFLLADECFSHMDKENTLKAYQLIQHECEMRKAGLVLTSLNETELPDIDVKLNL
ncbi:MAG: ATP-binding cassette domain-containing protein [Bacteroidia bacterium]|nr:MAG: ATP-binding cassette domain-containing protein [Bacteroidia bacterium]